jgi:hypothetical protein
VEFTDLVKQVLVAVRGIGGIAIICEKKLVEVGKHLSLVIYSAYAFSIDKFTTEALLAPNSANNIRF